MHRHVMNLVNTETEMEDTGIIAFPSKVKFTWENKH